MKAIIPAIFGLGIKMIKRILAILFKQPFLNEQ